MAQRVRFALQIPVANGLHAGAGVLATVLPFEKVRGGAVLAVVVSKYRKQFGWQRHDPILFAFALVHVYYHARAINMLHFKVEKFRKPQAAAVKQHADVSVL